MSIRPSGPPPLAGGGGGFTVSAETDRGLIDAPVNGSEIVPLDPTKATFVTITLHNNTGDAADVIVGLWSTGFSRAVTVPAGGKAMATLLVAAGESYLIDASAGGADTTYVLEQTIG